MAAEDEPEPGVAQGAGAGPYPLARAMRLEANQFCMVVAGVVGVGTHCAAGAPHTSLQPEQCRFFTAGQCFMTSSERIKRTAGVAHSGGGSGVRQAARSRRLQDEVATFAVPVVGSTGRPCRGGCGAGNGQDGSTGGGKPVGGASSAGDAAAGGSGPPAGLPALTQGKGGALTQAQAREGKETERDRPRPSRSSGGTAEDSTRQGAEPAARADGTAPEAAAGNSSAGAAAEDAGAAAGGREGRPGGGMGGGAGAFNAEAVGEAAGEAAGAEGGHWPSIVVVHKNEFARYISTIASTLEAEAARLARIDESDALKAVTQKRVEQQLDKMERSRTLISARRKLMAGQVSRAEHDTMIRAFDTFARIRNASFDGEGGDGSPVVGARDLEQALAR
jgi:hypothetical protein